MKVTGPHWLTTFFACAAVCCGALSEQLPQYSLALKLLAGVLTFAATPTLTKSAATASTVLPAPGTETTTVITEKTP